MLQTVLQGEIATRENNRPSLLRQIVDAADSLDDEGQAEVLKKIKLQKALRLAKQADEMLDGNTLNLSEDEIVEIVSKDRKKRFDEKTGL